MAGNSDKKDNLVDCLLADIDCIRGDINGMAGTRQWRVFTVKRKWSGCERGEGKFTDEEIELLPPPMIHPYVGHRADFRYNQEPCGFDEAGTIKVTEVSLCYSWDDLLGCEPEDNVEQLFKIVDQQGQRQPVRYFTNSIPPYPDRHNTIGWILYLEHVETGDCPDE